MRCGGDADGGPSAVLGQYSELRPLAARNRIPATPVALLRFGDSTAFDPRWGSERRPGYERYDTGSLAFRGLLRRVAKLKVGGWQVEVFPASIGLLFCPNGRKIL